MLYLKEHSVFFWMKFYVEKESRFSGDHGFCENSWYLCNILLFPCCFHVVSFWCHGGILLWCLFCLCGVFVICTPACLVCGHKMSQKVMKSRLIAWNMPWIWLQMMSPWFPLLDTSWCHFNLNIIQKSCDTHLSQSEGSIPSNLSYTLPLLWGWILWLEYRYQLGLQVIGLHLTFKFMW